MAEMAEITDMTNKARRWRGRGSGLTDLRLDSTTTTESRKLRRASAWISDLRSDDLEAHPIQQRSLHTAWPGRPGSPGSVAMKSRRPARVRQPVSCEPCRKRKIRCSRNRVPCDACVRRRCASQCTYHISPIVDGDGAAESNNSQHRANPQGNAGIGRGVADMARGLQAGLLHDERSSLYGAMTAARSHSPSSNSRDSPNRRLSSGETPIENTSTRYPRIALTLIDTQAGNVRYEPRYSQWASVLTNGQAEMAQGGLHGDSGDSRGFPFSADETISRTSLLSWLPALSHCDQLIDIYFDVFSPFFHVLHTPTFQQQYSDFKQSPSTASLSWVALLFAMLSVSVTALGDENPLLRDIGKAHEPSKRMSALASFYKETAMRCLAADQFLWRHSIITLQALLVVIYVTNSAHGQAWPLLGATYHIAIALGCHIDPAVFQLDPLQCEQRRRCWAGLMMLYNIQNTSMGNLELPVRRYSVLMPTDVEDADVSAEGIRNSRDGPTQVSYILFKLRLFNISTRICQTVLSTHPSSYSEVETLQTQISAEHRDWEMKYLPAGKDEPDGVRDQVHLYTLYGYSHQIQLLLHRPFFNRRSSTDPLNGTLNYSRDRCIKSALELISIHKRLAETSQYGPYRWYTDGIASFHAFHGAIVLVVALMDPEQRVLYEEIQPVLEECLTRFRSRAHRSYLCGRASTVLERLLNLACNQEMATEIEPVMSPGTGFESHVVATAGDVLSADEGHSPPSTPPASDPALAILDTLQPEYWLDYSVIDWVGRLTPTT